MAKQLVNADRLGYEDKGDYLQGVSFGELHALIHRMHNIPNIGTVLLLSVSFLYRLIQSSASLGDSATVEAKRPSIIATSHGKSPRSMERLQKSTKSMRRST